MSSAPRHRDRRSTRLADLALFASAVLVVPATAVLAVTAVTAASTPDALSPVVAGAPAADGPLGATGVLPGTWMPRPAPVPASTPPRAAPAALPTNEPDRPDLVPGDRTGIPATVLAAYRHAVAVTARVEPTCHLSWSTLAGIGRVESDHAAGGSVGASGRTIGVIRGPRLDGTAGSALVPDSDGGRLDGDRELDRPVGPMQFLPSVWAVYGADGDGDGHRDPDDVVDAATAAGAYLCAGGVDLADAAQLTDAVFRYNHSDAFVDRVLAIARAYASGVAPDPSDLDTSGASSSPLAVLASASRGEGLEPVADRPVASWLWWARARPLHVRSAVTTGARPRPAPLPTPPSVVRPEPVGSAIPPAAPPAGAGRPVDAAPGPAPTPATPAGPTPAAPTGAPPPTTPVTTGGRPTSTPTSPDPAGRPTPAAPSTPAHTTTSTTTTAPETTTSAPTTTAPTTPPSAAASTPATASAPATASTPAPPVTAGPAPS